MSPVQYRVDSHHPTPHSFHSFHTSTPRSSAAVPTASTSDTGYLWCFLYPGIGLNLYPHAWSVERMIPVGPAETLLVYDHFARPGTSEEEVEKVQSISRVLRALHVRFHFLRLAVVFRPSPTPRQ